jgi:hypothetical protein
MRNVTATGNSTGGDDLSKWTFTYSQLYQTIKQGRNEVTAKISCHDASNPTPLSEWHTVNITGVVPGQPIASTDEVDINRWRRRRRRGCGPASV